MKLLSLYINSFKNLQNLQIEFDRESLVNVFVGKNATGKSNLLEAILEIFRELSEEEYSTIFDYRLIYLINGQNVTITRSAGATNINGTIRRRAPESILPEHVIIYYTGHNNTVLQITKEYANEYRTRLRRNHSNTYRRFIGIEDEHTDNLLLSLALQEEENNARRALMERIGIESFGDEVLIKLKRPFYARSGNRAQHQIDRFDPETKFWRAGGDTRLFLNLLDTVLLSDAKGELRDEGYSAADGDEDYYLLYLDSQDLKEKLGHLSPLDIFRSLDNLFALGMLDSVSMDLNLTNGTRINSNMLSDGQFQSMIILGISEVFKNRSSLVIMDEPDSFLHPEWQFDFLSQVNLVSQEAQETNHIIITSHSGVSLIGHNGQIRVLRFDDGGSLICHPSNKRFAISQLSSRLMNYSEDEQMISILNKVGIESKPILFCEGYTDPIILNIAWDKLFEGPCPFHFIFSFGCENLRRTIQEERILKELEGLPVFGLFDFDTAYKEWSGVSFEEEIQTNPVLGLCRKVSGKNSYAMLIPIPDIEEIKKQVISPSGSHFGSESTLEIEHLFYGDENTRSYFSMIDKPGGNQIIDFNSNSKTTFASTVVPQISKEHFEVLRPMFEFMLLKSAIS